MTCMSNFTAQHAFLEDIQSLWPAGLTPSTGVWIPLAITAIWTHAMLPWTWSARQPPLLYNYLRTKNTLQLFLWFFFLSCFLNIWISKLNGLKQTRGGGNEKDSGVKRAFNSPMARMPLKTAVVDCTSTGWRSQSSWRTQASIRTAVGQHGTNYLQYKQHCVWA